MSGPGRLPSLFALFALLALAGCALFRANPLDANRGAVVLLFDTRTSGNLKSLRETLGAYDACATVFAAGPVNAGRAGELLNLRDDGHEIGLSGLKGVDARSYSLMYGRQKYFQDEIVTQALGAQHYGLNPRCFILPRFYEKASDGPALPAFLVSKGFARVVQRLPDEVAPQAKPVEKLRKPVIAAYVMTTNVFDRAQIASLAKRNEILVVLPNRQVLPMLLAEARAQGVPFATLSDLGTVDER